MKKMIVVGAGISGLSAAIYGARSGFDVTVYEMNHTFGGVSTSWSRKGYYFEGGMHWLTGSSEKLALNTVWKQVGALKVNNPVQIRDPFLTLFSGDKKYYMYRNVEQLKEHLLEMSPEDKKAINRLCRDIKYFMGVHLPVNDLPGLRTEHPMHPGLVELLKMVPAILRYIPLTNMTFPEYLNQFKDENIRHLFLATIGYRYNAASFIYTLASFASGDCGFPKGGSVTMAQNMVDTLTELGGKIIYRKKVNKVVVENGKAIGVETEDGFTPADAVIVTQDARKAIDTLFEPKINCSWSKYMRKNAVTEQNMFIGLGVKADLSRFPYGNVFPLKEPIEYAGLSFSELRIYNYSEYKECAPEGGTALTCLLLGPSYDFWKKAKEDGTYKQKKDELAALIIKRLSEFMPEVKDKVEVYDVATPCTYERYCDTYEGSWMSVWYKGGKQKNYPQTVKGIKGVYFAGMRIQMPGGLPIAVYTGRVAVQLACKYLNCKFV